MFLLTNKWRFLVQSTLVQSNFTCNQGTTKKMKQNYRDSNPIVTGLAETLGHTKLLDTLGLISIFNIHSTLIDFQMQIVALLN